MNMSAPLRGETQTKYQHKIVTVNETGYKDTITNKEFSAVELVFPDWVQVVALTPEKQLLLVQQYRFGNRTFTHELPGGAIEPGETPLEAGERELLEETGYKGKAVLIAKTPANPATQNNNTWAVLVEDAVKVADMHLDDNERITIEKMDFDNWRFAWAAGKLTHPYMLIALYATECYQYMGAMTFNLEPA